MLGEMVDEIVGAAEPAGAGIVTLRVDVDEIGAGGGAGGGALPSAWACASPTCSQVGAQA
jgi:hypothetical protein